MLDDVPLNETCLCCKYINVCWGSFALLGQSENTKDKFIHLFQNLQKVCFSFLF